MLNLTTNLLILTSNIPLLLIIANYTLLTTATFLIFNSLKLVSVNNSSTNSNESVALVLFNVLFFLNLAGVPPLPGFFIKINFLLNFIKYINIYFIFILVIMNFTIFYFYIQFYKTIRAYSKTKNYNTLTPQLLASVICVLFVFLNFVPLYNLLVLFIL